MSNTGYGELSTYNYTGTSALPLVLNANGGNVGIGTTTPNARLSIAGNLSLTGQLVSTVATGTAPLVVSSTTAVTNLNADLLDGQHGTYYMTASTDNWVNVTGDTMTGNLNMTGTSANVILGSNYLSGDGGDEGVFVNSAGNVV
jgi:hypothetical protein